MSESVETLNTKIRDIVAGIVAPDDADRAALLGRMNDRQAAGQDVSRDEHGFEWRAFFVYFAQKYPISTVMAPGAAVAYLYLIFLLIWG